MGNACDQVFETTELLELILSFTTLLDLLRAQRVSRRWKTVIEGSPLLQRCLYFLPDPRAVDTYGLNPLFMQRFKLWREEPDNTLHVSSKPQWHSRLNKSSPSASWRRMLVSQPPEPFRIEGGSPHRSNKFCGFSAETKCGDAWDVYYHNLKMSASTYPSTSHYSTASNYSP